MRLPSLLVAANPTLSPPSRSSSGLTLAGDEPLLFSKAERALPPGRRAILILVHLLASAGVALTSRRLGAGNAQLHRRAQLLPPLAFALLSLGAALPQLLPHLFARFGVEAGPPGRLSGPMLRRAIPVGALAAASVYICLELPRLASVEAEQAISLYAAPIVLLLAPVASVTLPRERLQVATLVVALFFAYALLSVSVSPRGAALSSLNSLWAGLFAILAKRALASCSALHLVSTFAPAATLFSATSLLTSGAPAMVKLQGWQTPHSWVRYDARPSPPGSDYATFVVSLIAEQVSAILAVQTFTSPLSFALLSLPRGLLVFWATYASAGATHLGLAFMLGIGLWAWADEEAGPLHLWRSWRRQRDGDDLPSPVSEKLHQYERTEEATATSTHYLRTFASLLPFLYFLLRAFRGDAYHAGPEAALSTDVVSTTGLPSLDLVFSYYDEPLDAFRDHIRYLRHEVEPIAVREPRVIVYVKSTPASLESFAHRVGADEVYSLPNIGREGATYLEHILRNYGRAPDPQTGAGGLADQTAFCQDHLSWHGTAEARVALLRPETGYLHFAPYIKSDCGRDLNNDKVFSRMRDIYTLFREELCPPTLQLAAWSAQFFVSKQRILANSVSKYKRMLGIVEAPSGHWLHNDTRVGGFDWGESDFGPSNPWIGHGLERSWPVIFGCDDPALADRCPLEVNEAELCQCFDR